MTDYKHTVRLPSTSFPMKADLPKKEPEWVKFWADQQVYEKLEKKGSTRQKFILHDGPPFANGHLHIGHALNRSLKDFVIKYQRLLGKHAPFIPGWDCHGLPIEWMIEEKYRKEKKSKDDVNVSEFRKECRAFAQKWVDIQREESKRLGMLGDWDKPYLTMDYSAEATIIAELYEILKKGNLYRGSKPVQWSVVEKTALAEAEVEYQNKVSPSIYVKFPFASAAHPLLKKSALVIWTTTPWTLPANRAVAYGPEIQYTVLKIQEVVPQDQPLPVPGDTLVVAAPLVEKFCQEVGIQKYEILGTLTAGDLADTHVHHPLYHQGYGFTVPLLPGDHVTTDQGTGFVHTAPSHGLEDFALGQAFGLEVPRLVEEDGLYASYVPVFAGQHIFKAQEAIIDLIKEAGNLLGVQSITHSYPHSWRSKAPLIYRATDQWFMSMEKNGLRETALKSISQDVKWFPENGANRIRSMVEDRPDWCLSRQRAWGVPIAIFVHKESGEPLNPTDPKAAAVYKRVVDAFAAKGADVWFNEDPKQFLSPEFNPLEYEPVRDILDVWFESGTTHAFVVDKRPELHISADQKDTTPILYFEGSDQHRGWFQSSLMESCATRGKAPYTQVVTHGFIVDAEGKKISKSAGNGVKVEDILEKQGADILRLWVAGSNYTNDLRIGPEILKRWEEVYRRIRNTLRYLLGNLPSPDATKALVQDLKYDDLPDLEKWILGKLYTRHQLIQEDLQQYAFNNVLSTIYTFCDSDLSSFYFDIRKDTLYCEADTSLKYRATLYVLDKLFDHICRWLSPILSFTCEEAWQARHGGQTTSIHLQEFLPLPSEWENPTLDERWIKLRTLREVITGALEQARASGRIGAPLQACPHVYIDPAHENYETYQEIYRAPTFPEALAEICITSNSVLIFEKGPEDGFSLDIPAVAEFKVKVELAPGDKCERCWKILPEVTEPKDHEGVCHRCDAALDGKAP